MKNPDKQPSADSGLDPTNVAPELGVLNEQAPMDEAAGGPTVDKEDDTFEENDASSARGSDADPNKVENLTKQGRDLNPDEGTE